MSGFARSWTFLAAILAAALTASAAGAGDRVRVGEGPFITGGAFYIAREKGYFKKLGLDIETRSFIDGAMAVPSMISGELDITLMTPNASLFNSVAKGAPLVVFLDRGSNRKGFAYTLVNVTQTLHDAGVRSLADFAKLKGKRMGVGALGSINQYNLAQALLKAGLNPATDVQWIANISQPDLMKMLGQGQLDATDLAWQFGVFAQQNKWGPIVASDDQIVPDAAIGMYAARRDFLTKNRDAAVRFAMACLYAAKEFNAAAREPDKYPEIVDILAKNTALNKPELVKKIAPNWGYISEDGVPLADSIMGMQDFWSSKYFHFVEKKVTREQLFDLSIAKEALARLNKEKPFAK
ncbi:MAG TPA: ABC transporter substrate-binding protein [Xanthobacteraceae bacterium]|jgi:NitT/TauT family transport system substrate-binding protein